MAQVLLSVLGTGAYKECNYVWGERRFERVHFFQEALLRMLAGELGAEDRVVVFLTQEARDKNWTSPCGNGYSGLEAVIGGIGLRARVEPVSIPTVQNEEELWQLFGIIFRQIYDSDEVILDLTHAFRFMPMLCLVVLNYARVLKNIRIKGIWYGAVESLGSLSELDDIPIEKRNAPVFDLLSFDFLLRWSFGADNLVRLGSGEMLARLIEQDLKPVLREYQGRNRLSNALRGFKDNLENLMLIFQTCRGSEIVSGTAVEKIERSMAEIKAEHTPATRRVIGGLIEALRPLIGTIEKKLEPFVRDDVRNGFHAVQWCLDHGLIQQGITMLQETILTYALYAISGELGSLTNVVMRTEVKEALHYQNKENELRAKIISTGKFPEKLISVMDCLNEYRNDINHGGFREDARGPADFEKVLREKLIETKSLLGLHP